MGSKPVVVQSEDGSLRNLDIDFIGEGYDEMDQWCPSVYVLEGTCLFEECDSPFMVEDLLDELTANNTDEVLLLRGEELVEFELEDCEEYFNEWEDIVYPACIVVRAVQQPGEEW